MQRQALELNFALRDLRFGRACPRRDQLEDIGHKRFHIHQHLGGFDRVVQAPALEGVGGLDALQHSRRRVVPQRQLQRQVAVANVARVVDSLGAGLRARRP